MPRSRRPIALLLLLCLILSGCSSQLEKTYSQVTPHKEQYEIDPHSDAVTADNYLGLKNAILNFVETGTEYGVMRIYNYDGNLLSDLSNAVYEVSRNDPLGAYAVNYMSFDYARILSYYEIYIYTTFRVTIEQIDSVIYCSDAAAAISHMEEALDTHNTQLTLRIANYRNFDPVAALHACFLSHPEYALCEPTYRCTVYPDTGVQRVVELILIYKHDLLVSKNRRESLAATSDSLAARLASLKDPSLALSELHRTIVRRLNYTADASDLFSSAYNILVKNYGNSKGVALAVRLICNKLDIPCMIVEGTLDRKEWYWNMVCLDDVWMHWDLCTAAIEQQSIFRLSSDDDMTEYFWDIDRYPACPASESEESSALQGTDLHTN